MKRFKDILCVVEPDEVCKPALEHAVALAESNQASLTVISTVSRISASIGMPEGRGISVDLQATAISSHTHKLELLIESFSNRINIDIKVLVGTLFLEIIREVLRHEHD